MRSFHAIMAALVAILFAHDGLAGTRVQKEAFATGRRCLGTQCYRFFTTLPGQGAFQFVSGSHPMPKDKSVVFAVSAAPSDKDHAAGCYVSHGSVKRAGRCEQWDAAAVLNVSQDKPVVIVATAGGQLLTKEFLDKKASDGRDLFQSYRLVNKGVAQSFAGNERHRYRALVVMKDNSPAVVESVDEVSLGKFSAALVKLGAEDAVYLDIGTKDAGWYRNPISWKIKKLGGRQDKFYSQTNWLVIRLP